MATRDLDVASPNHGHVPGDVERVHDVLERVAGLSYHHASAEDAWARILRFFDVHLRAGEQ